MTGLEICDALQKQHVQVPAKLGPDQMLGLRKTSVAWSWKAALGVPCLRVHVSRPDFARSRGLFLRASTCERKFPCPPLAPTNNHPTPPLHGFLWVSTCSWISSPQPLALTLGGAAAHWCSGRHRPKVGHLGGSHAALGWVRWVCWVGWIQVLGVCWKLWKLGRSWEMNQLNQLTVGPCWRIFDIREREVEGFTAKQCVPLAQAASWLRLGTQAETRVLGFCLLPLFGSMGSRIQDLEGGSNMIYWCLMMFTVFTFASVKAEDYHPRNPERLLPTGLVAKDEKSRRCTQRAELEMFAPVARDIHTAWLRGFCKILRSVSMKLIALSFNHSWAAV